jgi:hypothetical protein
MAQLNKTIFIYIRINWILKCVYFADAFNIVISPNSQDWNYISKSIVLEFANYYYLSGPKNYYLSGPNNYYLSGPKNYYIFES